MSNKYKLQNLKADEIKQYTKNDFENAFNYLQDNDKIKNLSENIKGIVFFIKGLSKEYKLNLKDIYLKDKLFQKLNTSNNIVHIGIGNIVYNIIFGERNCNNCQIVEEYSKLKKLATTDCLTGLYNRGPIEKEITKLLSTKKRSGTDSIILMIDIDYFKKINDTYGHSKGDKVLKEISKLLKENTRIEDTVGRMGGEEFIIILPGTNITDGEKVAEKIRKEVENNLSKNVKGINQPITISIGLTNLSKIDNTGEEVQDRADKALYVAKNSGRNNVKIEIKNPGEK